MQIQVSYQSHQKCQNETGTKRNYVSTVAKSFGLINLKTMKKYAKQKNLFVFVENVLKNASI